MDSLISPRACQLEAHNLDKSFDTIVDQCVEHLKLPILSDEIKLIFRSYVAYSYLKSGTTIGMNTYGMKFYEIGKDNTLHLSNSKLKIILMGACTLILPYITKKYSLERNLDESLYRLVKLSWLNCETISAITKVIDLIVFLSFLRNGQYLLIQSKILNLVPGMKVDHVAHSSAINKVQMEFMNREAIWRIIAEFSTTVVPFIKLNQLKEYALRPFRASTPPKDFASKILYADAKRVCGICKSQPFNPFMIGCSHIFCYYCLETRYLTNPTKGYSCPSCNFETQDVHQVRRYKIHGMLIK